MCKIEEIICAPMDSSAIVDIQTRVSANSVDFRVSKTGCMCRALKSLKGSGLWGSCSGDYWIPKILLHSERATMCDKCCRA
jgi:hypothetical protein